MADIVIFSFPPGKPQVQVTYLCTLSTSPGKGKRFTSLALSRGLVLDFSVKRAIFTGLRAYHSVTPRPAAFSRPLPQLTGGNHPEGHRASGAGDRWPRLHTQIFALVQVGKV